jgi:hypothetical protein
VRRGQRRRGEWKRKQRRLETMEAHSFPETAIEADLEEKAIQSKGNSILLIYGFMSQISVFVSQLEVLVSQLCSIWAKFCVF